MNEKQILDFQKLWAKANASLEHRLDHDNEGGVKMIVRDRYTLPATVYSLSIGNDALSAARAYLTDADAILPLEESIALVDDAREHLNIADALDWLSPGGTISRGIADRMLEEFAALGHDLNEIGGPLRERIMSSIDKKLSPTWQGLSEHLNPDALDALSHVKYWEARDYQFYLEQGEKAVYRKQAAKSFPMLANLFGRKIHFRRAIDKQSSLNSVILSAFGQDGEIGLTKSHMKALQKEFDIPAIQPTALLEYLKNTPADWVPRSQEDWDAYMMVMPAVVDVLKDTGGVAAKDALNGCKGKWSEYAQRLSEAYTDTRPPEGLSEEEQAAWLADPIKPSPTADGLRNAALDTIDMVWAFADQVVLPAAAHASRAQEAEIGHYLRMEAFEVARAILLEGRSAINLFETSRHYHSQRDRIDSVVRTSDDPDAIMDFTHLMQPGGWVPLTPITEAPGGLTIFPLTTTEALKAEGKAMSCCVGGYTSRCKAYGNHIISVRRGDKRLSVCQFSRLPEDLSITVVQHRGYHNGAVPRDAEAAVNWYIGEIMNGRLKTYKREIDHFLETQAELNAQSPIVGVCGYEWKNREELENAMREWAPYMPKGVRKLGFEGFLYDAPYLDKLARELNPFVKREHTANSERSIA